MLPNRHNLAKPDTLQPAENTAISTVCELITGDKLLIALGRMVTIGDIPAGVVLRQPA